MLKTVFSTQPPSNSNSKSETTEIHINGAYSTLTMTVTNGRSGRKNCEGNRKSKIEKKYLTFASGKFLLETYRAKT